MCVINYMVTDYSYKMVKGFVIMSLTEALYDADSNPRRSVKSNIIEKPC